MLLVQQVVSVTGMYSCSEGLTRKKKKNTEKNHFYFYYMYIYANSPYLCSQTVCVQCFCLLICLFACYLAVGFYDVLSIYVYMFWWYVCVKFIMTPHCSSTGWKRMRLTDCCSKQKAQQYPSCLIWSSLVYQSTSIPHNILSGRMANDASKLCNYAQPRVNTRHPKIMKYAY